MQDRDQAKDRRNIGKVEFLFEKMADARAMSSCCVGTEAILERDAPPRAYKPGETKRSS